MTEVKIGSLVTDKGKLVDAVWHFDAGMRVFVRSEDGYEYLNLDPSDLKAAYGILLQIEMEAEFKERRMKTLRADTK